MSRPNHRVAAGTRTARSLYNIGADHGPASVPPEVQRWNEKVEARKAAKRAAKKAKRAG